MPITILNIFPPHHFFSLAEDTGDDTLPDRPDGIEHSPARIIGQAIIDAGLGIDGEGFDRDNYNKNVWYVFDNREPDRPDLAITVYDTQGISFGYSQDGDRNEAPGIQIRLRSTNYRQGYYQLSRIAIFLDRLKREIVTIADESMVGTGSSDLTYIVNGVERTSNIIPLGTDIPQGKRLIFVINAVCWIRPCC